jgi:hypothetical protein
MGVSERFYMKGQRKPFKVISNTACIANLKYDYEELEDALKAHYICIGPPINTSVYYKSLLSVYYRGSEAEIVCKYIEILKTSTFNKEPNNYFKYRMYSKNSIARLYPKQMTYTEMLLVTSLVRYIWEYPELTKSIVTVWNHSDWIKNKEERANFSIFGGHIHGSYFSSGHSISGCDIGCRGILRNIQKCINKCKNYDIFGKTKERSISNLQKSFYSDSAGQWGTFDAYGKDSLNIKQIYEYLR